MLGEGPTDYVICVFGTFGNELGLTSSKAKKKFWSLYKYKLSYSVLFKKY